MKGQKEQNLMKMGGNPRQWGSIISSYGSEISSQFQKGVGQNRRVYLNWPTLKVPH